MILPESVLKMIPILDKYEVGSMDPVVTHGWLVAMAQELIEYRQCVRPTCLWCGKTFTMAEVNGQALIPTHDALPPARAVCPHSGKPIRTLQYFHPKGSVGNPD